MAFKKPVQAGDKVKTTAPLLDAGVYNARILSIVDLGIQPGSPQFPEEKLKLEFRFELCDEFMCDEAGELLKDKPRVFSYEVTYNEDGFMSEKSSIYKLISAIPNGFEFDLDELIGKPVDVMIQKYVKKSGKNAGKEDNKIASILTMKAKDAAQAPQLVNTPLFFDMSEPTLEVWNKLYSGNPYAQRDRIMASKSFNGSKIQALLGMEATTVAKSEVAEYVDNQAEVDLDADVPY